MKGDFKMLSRSQVNNLEYDINLLKKYVQNEESKDLVEEMQGLLQGIIKLEGEV